MKHVSKLQHKRQWQELVVTFSCLLPCHSACVSLVERGGEGFQSQLGWWASPVCHTSLILARQDWLWQSLSWKHAGKLHSGLEGNTVSILFVCVLSIHNCMRRQWWIMCPFSQPLSIVCMCLEVDPYSRWWRIYMSPLFFPGKPALSLSLTWRTWWWWKCRTQRAWWHSWPPSTSTSSYHQRTLHQPPPEGSLPAF